MVFLDGAGQALRLAEVVAVGKHRANQGGIIVGEEGVEGNDGCKAAVDGGGLKAPRFLGVHKAVDLAEGDRSGCHVSDLRGELAQVVVVVLPGAGVGVAPAHPVDELVDLG